MDWVGLLFYTVLYPRYAAELVLGLYCTVWTGLACFSTMVLDYVNIFALLAESTSSPRTRRSCERQLSSPFGTASGRGHVRVERQVSSPPTFDSNKPIRKEDRESGDEPKAQTNEVMWSAVRQETSFMGAHVTSSEVLIPSSMPLLVEGDTDPSSLGLRGEKEEGALGGRPPVDGDEGRVTRSRKG